MQFILQEKTKLKMAKSKTLIQRLGIGTVTLGIVLGAGCEGNPGNDCYEQGILFYRYRPESNDIIQTNIPIYESTLDDYLFEDQAISRIVPDFPDTPTTPTQTTTPTYIPPVIPPQDDGDDDTGTVIIEMPR
jgi:hypothetical protein